MNLVATGWSRVCIIHQVGSINLQGARWNYGGTRAMSRTYCSQHGKGVTVMFGAKVNMSGNFDFQLRVSRADAALLFAKAYEGVPFGEAITALAPHFADATRAETEQTALGDQAPEAIVQEKPAGWFDHRGNLTGAGRHQR